MTVQYRDGLRAAHYAATRGDEDFAALSSEVARLLSDAALANDPAQKLALEPRGRQLLAFTAPWPNPNVWWPDEPNLYREIFPYSEVCKVPFDGVILPPNPPEEIWMTDTTFRDGQQARAPYTPEQIVALFKLMPRLGGQNGIIRQTEFFLYSEKDKEAVRRCQELGYRFETDHPLHF